MSPDMRSRLVELIDTAHLLEELQVIEGRHFHNEIPPTLHTTKYLDRRLRQLAIDLNRDLKRET